MPMTSKDVANYCAFLRFTCPKCDVRFDMDRIGLTVSGQIVIVVICNTCDPYEHRLLLDHDFMLKESHRGLVKEMLG